VNIWAIVPVKPFNRSKSRLAPVLSSKQRAILSRQMLEQTLQTLRQVDEISGVLVVSRDTAALSLARRYDAQTVQESGSPELNDALTRATQAVVATWKARGVLILASDIPLMRVQDVKEMLALAAVPPAVVLATDRRQDGTNALLIRPAGLITYSYGARSFHRHLEAARMAGVEPQVYDSPTLALDVDIPADLDLYREMLIERELGQPAWLGSD